LVTGGIFDRDHMSAYPATVDDFVLDRFEVTLGRFRAWVAQYPTSIPAMGDGSHTLISFSGWNRDWDADMPADQTTLTAALDCNPTFTVWTAVAGGTENKPINCVNWLEAFAFCAWDGGRLATEAELNYAMAGGAEQRQYPWGDGLGATYAVYECTGDGSPPNVCNASDIQDVGSRSPKGDSKWGHADLSGNLYEWVLDLYENPYAPGPCVNCANIGSGEYRVVRGGMYQGSGSTLLVTHRYSFEPATRTGGNGFRCARNP